MRLAPSSQSAVNLQRAKEEEMYHSFRCGGDVQDVVLNAGSGAAAACGGSERNAGNRKSEIAETSIAHLVC